MYTCNMFTLIPLMKYESARAVVTRMSLRTRIGTV